MVLAFGLLTVLVAPGWSDEDPKPRDQQVKDIEKQIQSLQKQLNELKKDPAPTEPTGPKGALPDSWASALSWRCIGPASMGGRITAISVFEADPTTYWVATASGGLVKTTNNGTTFEHQFEREGTVSIGDVCVAPSDKNVVWVGTGENNPRNSVSFGDGVYKSTDGGKTWKNMGLKQSYQTGRVAIHPTDPNTVYVGALGRLYGPNQERGVFKTTDGGATWEKVLYFDENTGCIDLRIHPTEPNVLWAAMWERKRDGFDSYVGETPPDGYDGYDPSSKYGPHAGLYKTTDGGKTWNKLTKGLPNCKTGRIGLDVYLKDPKVLFAIVDSEKIGTGTPPPPQPYMGIQGEDTTGGVKLTAITPNSPATKAELKVDDVLTAMEGKPIVSYEKFTEEYGEKKIGDKVKLAVKRGNDTLDITVTLETRPPQGGRGGPGGGAPAAAPTPYMGVQGEDATGGAKLTSITENSPAARAGLKADDLVTAMDGKPVTAFEKFADEFSAKKIGEKVKLTVKRGEETKEIEVPLEARPELAGGGRGGANAPGSRVRPYGFMYAGQSPNVQKQQGPDGEHTGGIYKSTDGGDSWTRINSLNPRPMYFSVVRVDPSDDQKVYVLGISFYSSTDGGKTFKVDPGKRNVHDDQHALWIDPRDGRHMLIGTDGGFYVTYDRMAHWDHLTLAALGQFYHVCVDNRKPYRVIGGLQDNGSWSGPSRTLRNSGPINEEWYTVSGGDGFVCRVDPDDPDLIYTESQGGVIGRRNVRTGERGAVRARAPGAQTAGPQNVAEQAAVVAGGGQPATAPGGGGDGPRGGQATTPGGGGDGPRGGRGQGGGGGGGGGFGGGRSPYQFNWNTPFILSSHNPRIVYVGGNFVFRSLKQGDDLKIISPSIIRTKRGTATALSESPRNPDVLWAGTDDGNLWITRDGGVKWTNVADKVSGLPGPRWVSTIEASRFAEGRAYVCFDAHRSDDDKPYCFVTENFGETWKPITNNLPAFGSSRCLREDPTNQNLLFCGTEFACFASTNRGATWTKINNNLPTVAIHELAIHPTAGEMVAATHGRSLWVLDISALRQVKVDTLEAAAHLYAPQPATKWRTEPEVGSMYGNGSKKFYGQNPPAGTNVYLSFAKKPEKASLKVFDVAGQLVRELAIKSDVGFQRVNWNLTRASAQPIIGAIRGTVDPEQAMRRPGGMFGASVAPGQYRLVLNVDGKEYVQTISVEADPITGSRQIAAGGDEDEGKDGDDDEEQEEKREKEREREMMKRLLDR
jgi:photosystem II stability/assembly factor-like uncharacterized protein